MTGLEFLAEFLPIVVYILLIVVLIIGIVLGIKLIITMDKVEKVVDDVNEKVQSLNGFFSLVDFTTDKIASFSDAVVNALSTGISKVFGFFGSKRKKGKEYDEENEIKKKSGAGKFVFGAVLGAGLGVLFAPKKGSETRRQLKEKLEELKSKVKEIDVDDVKEEVLAKVDELKSELEDLDKEKVLKLAKQKAKVLQAKAEDLYDYAVAKGTPVVEKIATDIREKTLSVAKDVVARLEEQEKKKDNKKEN